MEDSAKGFSDFGGGLENNETPLQTAYREGSEELSGYLGDSVAIKKRVEEQGKVYKMVHNDYHIHIFFMEYDENLPKYYNNNHAFLWKRMDQKVLNDSKLFEKIEIRWFSEDELRTQRSLFRSFYQEMVDKMREQLPKIRAFIDSKQRKPPARHTRKKVRFTPSHREMNKRAPIVRTATPYPM